MNATITEPKFIKTTVKSTKIDGIYERTITAEIDQANELIHIEELHINTVKGIRERQSFWINFADLDALNAIVKKANVEGETR